MRMPLNFADDRVWLEWLVLMLNGRSAESGVSAELLEFIELWNKSGRNPYKNPFFDAVVSTKSKRKFSLVNMAKATKWILVPVDGSGNPIDIFDERAQESVRDGGARWFPVGPYGIAQDALRLITNPLRWRLSDGPCLRERCGKWFIKRRRGQKTCSSRCLHVVRAAVGNEAKRKNEHKERLKRARKARRSWRKKNGDWKIYVSKKTGLSKKFLTRAVNKGELK